MLARRRVSRSPTGYSSDMTSLFPASESTVRHAFALPLLLALATAIPAAAEAPIDWPFATDGLHVVEAEGRGLVVLPSSAGIQDDREAASGDFVARSFDADSRRIHVVTFEGETFTAATPLDGPRSWIAFDPGQRAFASLLPSVRVELDAGLNLEAIAAEVGATGVTVLRSLGFAIVDLPDDVHPADAVARIQELPGQPEAAVRLRGPRIEWR